MANDVRYQTLMIMTKFSFLQGFGTASTGVINKRKSNCNTLKEAIFTLQRMWGISAPFKERGRLSFKYSLALGIRKVHLKAWSCCQASRFPLLITQTSKRASAIHILDWKYWCEFRWGDKSINPMAHNLSRGLNGHALLFGPLLSIRGRSHHLPDWRKTEKKDLKAEQTLKKGRHSLMRGLLLQKTFHPLTH